MFNKLLTHQLASTHVAFGSAIKAAEWAANVMVWDGATLVLLDAPEPLTFVSLLDFSRAPEGIV